MVTYQRALFIVPFSHLLQINYLLTVVTVRNESNDATEEMTDHVMNVEEQEVCSKLSITLKTMPVVNCVFDQKFGQHNSEDKHKNVHVMNSSISRLAIKSLCNYKIIRTNHR